jgi:hypothetical protein
MVRDCTGGSLSDTSYRGTLTLEFELTAEGGTWLLAETPFSLGDVGRR